MGDKRVLLIHMPFGGVDRPAIGISLLKSALEREGLGCDIAYFNLLFAEMIGSEDYGRFTYHGGVEFEQSLPYTAFPGDWLFSQYLYGPGSLDADAYAELLRTHPEYLLEESSIRRLFDLRAKVQPFLRACLARIDFDRYDLIGFTSTFEQNLASLSLAKLIKQRRPGMRIAMGGANCESVMGEELHRRYEFLDYVSIGEADRSFPRLVKAVRAGREPENVEGIVRRSGGRSLSHGPPRMIEDLDALPYPDFDDYFRQFATTSLNNSFEPWLQIESARGCWWGERSHCTFCGLNGLGMRFRSKNADRVLAEIDHLVKRYSSRNLSFVDNIMDLRYFDTLLPKLAQREETLNIFYETKSNLKRRQIRMLREAGVRDIQPGIESLSSGVLRLMRKGVSALANIQTIKWCHEMGVNADFNIIYGFPGEDPADYEKMLPRLAALTHFKPPSAVASIRLDRYSPNFNEARARGFSDVRPMPVYRHIYALNEASLRRLCYFFQYRHADGRDPEVYAEAMVRFWGEWRRKKRGNVTFKRLPRGGGEIIDTRFNRVVARVRLDAVQAAILEYCDSARSERMLLEHLARCFPKRRFKAGRLRSFLDYLAANRFMVEEDGVYLSVVPLREAPREKRRTVFARDEFETVK